MSQFSIEANDLLQEDSMSGYYSWRNFCSFFAWNVSFIANIVLLPVTPRWWRLFISFQMTPVLIKNEISVGVYKKWIHEKEWMTHEIVRIHLRVVFCRQRVFSISSWELIPAAMAASSFEAFYIYFERVQEGIKMSGVRWATKKRKRKTRTEGDIKGIK